MLVHAGGSALAAAAGTSRGRGKTTRSSSPAKRECLATPSPSSTPFCLISVGFRWFGVQVGGAPSLQPKSKRARASSASRAAPASDPEPLGDEGTHVCCTRRTSAYVLFCSFSYARIVYCFADEPDGLYGDEPEGADTLVRTIMFSLQRQSLEPSGAMPCCIVVLCAIGGCARSQPTPFGPPTP